MKECILKLDSCDIEQRNRAVFYASSEYMIYKSGSNIVCSTCDEEVLAETRCPDGFILFTTWETASQIGFVFNKKDIVVYDKIQYKFYKSKIGLGECITDPIHVGSNSLFFATRLHGKTQFVNYDFMNEKRISQTKSWDLKTVTSICRDSSLCYAVLDRSLLVCCDINTGETKWTRFEASKIGEDIFAHENRIFYCCNNSLKINNQKKLETVRVPLLDLSSAIALENNIVYAKSNEYQNMCAFNPSNKKLEWEARGTNIISQCIIAKGRDGRGVKPIAILRCVNQLNIIDLTSGASVFSINIHDMFKIRITGDHVLVSCYGEKSKLISGI